MSVTKGHCLCGEVSFEFTGPMNGRAHCHCESCRRNCSAPFTAFFGVPKSAHRWTGRVPQVYRSSPEVERSFCPTCGTPMSYQSARYPDEIELYAASLEHPENFAPQYHVNCAEQLPWIRLDDGLPRHARSSSATPDEKQ
jgi:hypothetical protein